MSIETQMDAFESSLLGASFTEDQVVAVKAEDLESEGFDFSKHFFEPQPGNTYLIKFLPNPTGDLISHRSYYRSLPDPDRKGKTFRYISNGNAKTCPVLQLFFDLNDQKKSGDPAVASVAEKKIEKYLSRSNQGCCRVQILNSPKKEEIGQIRLFVFSTFGPNATISNLINNKVNPTKQQLENGFEREDIFNIFESPVLSLVCVEEEYKGNKGRGYSQSSWAPKKRGALLVKEDGSFYEFKKADLVDGKLTPEVLPYFQKFVEVFKNPDVDPSIHFSYRDIASVPQDDPNYEYLKSVLSKVERIIPIIRDGSLTEIANFGKEDKSATNEQANKSVLEDSIPDELKDMVEQPTQSQTTQPAQSQATQSMPTAQQADEVSDILLG